ncbi:MAG TPA: hypothetical protein VH328_15670 [Burkholderiaceae bacterium]|jgi:hypothetical protein|nr:hypothetical protein [Burkholderiaceae bacterium]
MMHLIAEYKRMAADRRAREVERATALAALQPKPTPRPTLTVENVGPYLDWLMGQHGRMADAEMRSHLAACELLVRTRMGEAQAKDTQHTLVRDGVIDPPPPTPGGVVL